MAQTMEHVIDINAIYFYGVHVTRADLPADIYNKCMKYGGNCLACGITDYLWEEHKLRLHTSDVGYIYPKKYAIIYVGVPSKSCYHEVEIAEVTKRVTNDDDYISITAEESDAFIELARKRLTESISNNIMVHYDTENDTNNSKGKLMSCLKLLGITKTPSIVCDIYSEATKFFCDKCGNDIVNSRWNSTKNTAYDLCNACYNKLADQATAKGDYVHKEVCDIKLVHEARLSEVTYESDSE